MFARFPFHFHNVLRSMLIAALPFALLSCGGSDKPAPATPTKGIQASTSLSAAPTEPPAAPAGLAATAGNGEVTLSWTPVAGATSYTVYYLTYPGVTSTNAKQRTSAISGDAIGGLANGVAYYFRVTASNADGESAVSQEVWAKPMQYLPGQPHYVQLTGGLGEATLFWQSVPNATSYNVYYGTSPGVTTASTGKIKGVTLTRQKITGLTAAPGHYYFMVTAVNDSGESAPSLELAAVAKSAYKSVTAGYGFSAAVRIMEPVLSVDIGTVWEWGDNSSGQLGTGGSPLESTTARMTPTISSVTNIAAGYSHAVALKTDNSVANWGLNNKGQLGTNGSLKPIENAAAPVTAFAPYAMTQVAAGYEHTVALKNDGTVWTWGYNLLGALGYASINCENRGDINQPLAWSCSDTPTQVTGITGSATAIAAGLNHTLAVASDGTVWSWGRNDTGQLGTNIVNCPDTLVTNLNATAVGFDPTTLSCSTTPVQIPNIPGTTIAVTAGTRHSVALTSDGKVWTWGGNHYGQLGITASPMRTCTLTSVFEMPCTTTPGLVQGLDQIIAISAGSDHTLALRSDGTVWAWGYNNQGQLGTGSFGGESAYPNPVQVPGLTGITAIAAGAYHSLALKNDGTVWAWGYNSHGQLGNNTRTSSATPVKVQGLLGPVVILPGL